MNDKISTIFNNLAEYEKAFKSYAQANLGKGAVGSSNADIQKYGKVVLSAMQAINSEVTAEKGPMNGLRCFTNLNPKTGIGQGRAKHFNSFYLTWETSSAIVEGVELNCYVAMNFVLCGNQTNAAKIHVGCGFWVKCDEKKKNYSERIRSEALEKFSEFRAEFAYPMENGKFVKDDCKYDKDLVSCTVIAVPEPGADGKIKFEGEEEIVVALNHARETCGKVSKWIDDFANKPIFELLEANHQIVLTGAPGTGKTYLAEKLIAPSFVKTEDPNDKASERVFKVQFHPGYDYSDFVVGLKPVLVNKDGKEVGEPKEGDQVSVTFKWKKGLFCDIAEEATKEYEDAKIDGREPKKYVLIIDEINRADLSRVFGELFSQLESGYRYRLTNAPKEELETEKIKEKSKGILLPNKERLVIPDNLYIIGTMNDIERSVESMDFAMRRRFGWHEVTAEASKAILAKADGSDSSLIKAMDELNKLIEGTKGLGKEYHLGGAIFAKIAQYDATLPDQERYELLWRNHIANTLKDYLRGNPKASVAFNSLKEAYDKCVVATRKGLDEEDDEDNGANGAAKKDGEGVDVAKETTKPGEAKSNEDKQHTDGETANA